MKFPSRVRCGRWRKRQKEARAFLPASFYFRGTKSKLNPLLPAEILLFFGAEIDVGLVENVKLNADFFLLFHGGGQHVQQLLV